MIALPVLIAQQRAAQRRVGLDTVAMGLPGVIATAALAWRLAGLPALLGVALVGLAALAVEAGRRTRRLDRRWLTAQLDARVPGFEDSTALLLQAPPPSSGFAGLQRARLEARIAEATLIDLRPPWSRRAIAWCWGVSALATVAALLWPQAGAASLAPRPEPAARAAAAGPPRVRSTRLRIIPPGYTGLPVREQSTLDARAPEGSRVEWTIAFEPGPSAAALAFPDDGPVRLVRDGQRWRAARVIDRSMLYRVEAPGLARQRLHRIDATPDAPPVVRAVAPASQLVLVTPGQTRWTPVFEATDDYGVAEAASLRITVTQGDGENITFTQRSVVLRGQGEARRRRFSTTLDLAREGLQPAGDLIVQLVVSDNRAPERQEVEGPSVVLRWPPATVTADGLDSMAVRVMPAYFRSQRQIIIDAEALLTQRRRIAPEPFVDRSNGLGEDQAQLRLRYGQFMGEEGGGGGGGIALPTNDAPAAPPPGEASPPEAAPEAGHEGHEAHDDHAGEAPESAFGSPVDALNEFGHAHDTGDAATLFDPGTRSTLSLALDAMWSSERSLRQGRPDEALPFARQALEYLKEAQQASRIFLDRTSPDLPPIDLSRRMTGKRDGIIAGGLAEGVGRPVDPVPAQAWRALEERPGDARDAPLRLDALERWVRDNRARLPDPLGLTAAIDTVRGEPGCLDCRRRLRALLWRAMEPPGASVRRRDAPGARGRRYLDALR